MKLLQVWGQSWPRLAFGCQRARRSDRLAFSVPVLISDLVYDTWGSKGLESVSQESQVLKKRHPLHWFCHIPVFCRYTVSRAQDTQSCWTVHRPSTPRHTWHLKMQFSLPHRGTSPGQPSAPWQCGSPADKAGCCWLKMPLSGATQFVDLRFPYLTILKPL